MNRTLIGLFAAGLVASASASSINDDLEKLGGAAAEGYLGPVVSTLGANLNQGWFFEAPKPELWGINISARTVTVGTSFSSSDETFNTTTSMAIDENTAMILAKQMVPTSVPDTAKGRITQQIADSLLGMIVNMTISGPTLIGSTDDEIALTMNSADTVRVPGQNPLSIKDRKVPLGVKGAGLNDRLPISGVPLLFPQLTVGTLAGTQLALRWSPTIQDFSFFGIGINHNPGFWLEAAQLPFGINSSVNFAWSKMAYGDYLEFTAWNAGVTASRQLGFRFLNIAPFVSFGYEASHIKVSYETSFNGADGKPLKVGFEADGDNAIRTTFGSKIRLFVLDLGGSYTIAKYNSAAINIGLAF